MDRREALKAVAILMGGAISASSLSMMLNSCTTETKQSKEDNFTNSEKKIIERMCDIIIPRTDTPGAIDARAPAFLVMMMQECYTPEDQEKFHLGLASFDKKCKEISGASFLKLTEEKQEEVVKALDAEVLGKGNKNKKDDQSTFYRNLKALTLLGFFTSEPGATETLRYAQVPGKFEGCIPYHKGEKAWADKQ